VLDSHEVIFKHIIDDVETRFSKGSTTGADVRSEQLRRFLEKCSAFKNALCRDPGYFVFHCSATGSEFSEEHMTSIGSDEQPGRVKLSLWPGLYQGTPGAGYEIVEPELVWTMEEAQL
jgi:hypothetical protein